MIHAYNEYYLDISQVKLACMFELAVNEEKIDIDDFANKFISSNICKAFESGNPIYISGKSANELLALVLNSEPKNYEESNFASPEYWVGYVFAYVNWYLNIDFMTIQKYFSCSKILENYFPYHEMDIMQIVELIKKQILINNKLKELRLKHGYTQSELAILSNVPIRNIRAYEQDKQDISKAQADTLYALSKILDCKIEDLIK